MNNSILAVALGFLFPGLGHAYLRQWKCGLAFLAGTALPGLLAGPLGGVISFGVWVWSMMDAYRSSRAAQPAPPTAAETVLEAEALGPKKKFDLRPYLPILLVPIGISALVGGTAGLILARKGMRAGPGPETAAAALVERIQTYREKTGSLPGRLEDLVSPTDPIERKEIFDRWGRPLLYRLEGQDFRLFSSGRDRQPGTDDDVVFHPADG